MKGEYNKSSSLLKYDCGKARLSGVFSMHDDLNAKGYEVKRIGVISREAFGCSEIALVEIKIKEIIHPDYITELTPLWEFKN